MFAFKSFFQVRSMILSDSSMIFPVECFGFGGCGCGSARVVVISHHPRPIIDRPSTFAILELAISKTQSEYEFVL